MYLLLRGGVGGGGKGDVVIVGPTFNPFFNKLVDFRRVDVLHLHSSREEIKSIAISKRRDVHHRGIHFIFPHLVVKVLMMSKLGAHG